MKPVTAPGYSLRQILRNRIPGEKGCEHCSGFGILRTITLPPVTQALSDLTAHLPTVFSDLSPHHFYGRGEGSSALLLLKMSLTLASRRGGAWGGGERHRENSLRKVLAGLFSKQLFGSVWNVSENPTKAASL